MRKMVLAAIFGLAASTSLAQTDTAQQPATPSDQAPAPASPEAAPSDPTGTRQTAAGRPANLCQELLAFVRENSPEPDASAQTSAQQPAAAASSAGTEAAEQTDAPAEEQTAAAPAQPAEEDTAPADETTAAAGEDSSPASGEAVPPQPSSESGSAQDVSGQSGPAHGAPEPNAEQAAQTNVDNAPQTSSLSAPVPAEETEAEENIPLSLAKAEELADANDIVACQDAARQLRLAGAPMPEPLLALTALDLQYQTQANEAERPAAAPEAPADQTQPQE